jgi:hypothetical protein
VTAAEITQVCTSIGTLVGVIVTAIISIRSSFKIDAGKAVSEENKAAIEEVHKKVDGLGDARDAATQKSAYAEGVLAQRENEGQAVGPLSPDTAKHPPKT